MNAPTVSICIPVRNGMPFLPETLASALGQEGVDVEIVVRDNGSTDGTIDYLRELDDPRVRVLYAESPGSLPDNFRAVTDAARGEFVKLLCADDLIRPDACVRQVAALREPGVAVVASRRDLIDNENKVLLAHQGLRWLHGRRTAAHVLRVVLLLGYNPIGEPAGVMFRRRDYEAVGGWDGRRVYPMDLDLWLKLLHKGDLVGQPESLAAFRLSPGSLSGQREPHQLKEHRELVTELVGQAACQVPPWQRRLADFAARANWWLWSRRQHRLLRSQRALR